MFDAIARMRRDFEDQQQCLANVASIPEQENYKQQEEVDADASAAAAVVDEVFGNLGDLTEESQAELEKLLMEINSLEEEPLVSVHGNVVFL